MGEHSRSMGVGAAATPLKSVCSAFCLVAGMGMQIASCIIEKNGWPMLGILTYAIPFALILLIASCRGPAAAEGQSDVADAWIGFLGGLMGLSFFGMPVVLVHNSSVE